MKTLTTMTAPPDHEGHDVHGEELGCSEEVRPGSPIGTRVTGMERWPAGDGRRPKRRQNQGGRKPNQDGCTDSHPRSRRTRGRVEGFARKIHLTSNLAGRRCLLLDGWPPHTNLVPLVAWLLCTGGGGGTLLLLCPLGCTSATSSTRREDRGWKQHG